MRFVLARFPKEEEEEKKTIGGCGTTQANDVA